MSLLESFKKPDDDLLAIGTKALLETWKTIDIPSALNKNRLMKDYIKSFWKLYKDDEFLDHRIYWEALDEEVLDNDIQSVVDHYASWYQRSINRMFSNLGSTSLIARVVKLDSLEELKEDFGVHWTIPVSNAFHDDFLLSINIADDGDLYVLLAEVPTDQIQPHAMDMFLFGDEQEVGVMHPIFPKIKWCVICRYHDVDTTNPKNSKVLKQFK
jgi:hypothetical protein